MVGTGIPPLGISEDTQDQERPVESTGAKLPNKIEVVIGHRT